MHKISIIGLGQIGASIGLGLRKKIKGVEIVGHDIEPTTAGQARKIGAVDKISYSFTKFFLILFFSVKDNSMPNLTF